MSQANVVAPIQQVQADQQLVSNLQPGIGDMSLSANSFSNSLSIALRGGVKFTPSWAAFGDSWANPLLKTYGIDVGIAFKNASVFAGGWGSTDGETGGQVGLSFSF
jgi:hypothetical protein